MSLITKAGFGVGRDVAKVFAREGSSLVLADRNVKTARSLAVEAAEGPARACQLVSDPACCLSFHRRDVRSRQRPYGWVTR